MKKLIIAASFLLISAFSLQAQTATRAVQTASPVIYVDREPAKIVSVPATTTTTTTTTSTASSSMTTSGAVSTTIKTEVPKTSTTPTSAAEDGAKKACCKSGSTGKPCCKSGTSATTITPVFSPTTNTPKENH
jgi:hypothetical protein